MDIKLAVDTLGILPDSLLEYDTVFSVVSSGRIVVNHNNCRIGEREVQYKLIGN